MRHTTNVATILLLLAAPKLWAADAPSLPEPFASAFAEQCARSRDAAALTGLYEASFFDRHVLLVDADGRFRFAAMVNSNAITLVSGKTERDGDWVRLLADVDQTGSSAAPELFEQRLLFADTGREQFLIEEEELDDLARNIHWSGQLDRAEAVFRRRACSGHADVPYDAGYSLPPYAELPPALRARLREAPIVATVTAVLALPNADPAMDADEALVAIDQGADDGLHINMPLCRGYGTAQTVHGWVLDVEAHRSTFRVCMTCDDRADERVPEPGARISSRRADCLGR